MVVSDGVGAVVSSEIRTVERSSSETLVMVLVVDSSGFVVLSISEGVVLST